MKLVRTGVGVGRWYATSLDRGKGGEEVYN